MDIGNLKPDDLIFAGHPVVDIGGTKFIDVPVILQYEQDPLILIANEMRVGFSAEFRIFHSDGTYLAKVVGSRLFATEKGGKAGLKLRHPAGMTVCELEGATLFEVRRNQAAGLKTQAELYTPHGGFIRCLPRAADLFKTDEHGLEISTANSNIKLVDCAVIGWPIGIRVDANGGIGIGTKLGQSGKKTC